MNKRLDYDRIAPAGMKAMGGGYCLRERFAPVRDARVALALLTNVFANGGLLMVYTYAGLVLEGHCDRFTLVQAGQSCVNAVFCAHDCVLAQGRQRYAGDAFSPDFATLAGTAYEMGRRALGSLVITARPALTDRSIPRRRRRV